MEPFGESGVGDDAAAVVEHGVADEVVDERGDLGAELVGFGVELGEGFGEAVEDLDVAAVQGAPQLVLVVAGDAPGGAVAHHAFRPAGWLAVDRSGATS